MTDINETNETMDIDLDDLLDGELSDLPDMSFDAWPDGSYYCTCSLEPKKITTKEGKSWSIEAEFKLLTVQELANPGEDIPPKEGAKNSTICMLNNEFGRAALKKLLTPFAERFGITRQRELIDMVKDVEVVVVHKRKFDKKNEVWRFNPITIAVV